MCNKLSLSGCRYLNCCLSSFNDTNYYFSLLLYTGLGALAFEYWLHSKSSENTQSIKGSYKQMNDSFGPTDSPKQSNSIEPRFTKSIFNKPEDKISEIELTTINNYEKVAMSMICKSILLLYNKNLKI